MKRRRALVMLASSAIGAGALNASSSDRDQQCEDHEAWVADVLQEILTVKPGMTRRDLLELFTTGGGISSRTWRTYVSKRCVLFQVDVEFQAVGEPDIGDTPGFLYEADDDIILKISRPYLQFEVKD